MGRRRRTYPTSPTEYRKDKRHVAPRLYLGERDIHHVVRKILSFPHHSWQPKVPLAFRGLPPSPQRHRRTNRTDSCQLTKKEGVLTVNGDQLSKDDSLHLAR
jgi:hypothetical protein